MELREARSRLKRLGSRKRAEASRGFFKTGPGEYGEGDEFLGVTMPALKGLARQCADLKRADLRRLLWSPLHEERLLALVVLVRQYEKASDRERRQIFDFYLKNTARINNWDLVDLSAPRIVGMHLLERDRRVLYRLVRSQSLWERRIAVISSAAFIKAGQCGDTFKLCELLLYDPEDLMHKACGWMLREAEKRDGRAVRRFLKRHHKVMPRTMLRYAIERFPERERAEYLKRGR